MSNEIPVGPGISKGRGRGMSSFRPLGSTFVRPSPAGRLPAPAGSGGHNNIEYNLFIASSGDGRSEGRVHARWFHIHFS